MNYNVFINTEVINKNNEEGIVTAFDEKQIVVKYSSSTKTYNPNIALKNGFLSFKNQDLMNALNEDLISKDNNEKKKEENLIKIQKEYLLKKRIANDIYKRMCRKKYALLTFFGNDFVYPPLKAFEKKYKHLIDKSSNIFWDDYCFYRWHYGEVWYY